MRRPQSRADGASLGRPSASEPLAHPVVVGTLVPIIVLNWNGTADTIACLRSIAASEYAGFVPFLVDNGSTLESLDDLKKACSTLFRDVSFVAGKEIATRELSTARLAEIARSLRDGSLVFVEAGENLGFAGGTNLGIRLAELLGMGAVMLLNNDTIVDPAAFREMRSFIEAHPEFGAATAQIRHFRDPDTVQNCGGELTFFGGRTYRFANKPVSRLENAAFSRVSFATGCALFLRHGVLGYLTERFFFGEEDYDLALRAKAQGIPMACVHGAVVFHKGGATLGRAAKPLGAILVHYVNRLINVRSHYSGVRWHVTRILAYLYLPVLLRRSVIDLRRSAALIREIDRYVASHEEVGRADFMRLVGRS